MITNIDCQQFAQLFKGKSNTYVRNELPKEAPEPGTKIKTKITNNEGKADKDQYNDDIRSLESAKASAQRDIKAEQEKSLRWKMTA